MKLFLEVSFPSSIPKESLTYHIDCTTDSAIPQVGCRVAVPIQGRYTVGYIISTFTTPPNFSTKPVAEIIDYFPLLPEKLIQLGFIVSKRYLCSVGEAFDAMLPAGIKQKLTKVMIPSDKLIKLADKGEQLPNALIWLIDKRSADLNEFMKNFPKSRSKISQWVNDELVEISFVLSRKAMPKFQTMFYLKTDCEIPVDSLTPKEKAVVELLLRENRAMKLSEICRLAKVSSSPIAQLVRKGHLSPKMERVVREVATEEFYKLPAAPVPQLSSFQETALQTLREEFSGMRRPVLIWGVTCSGKTEVYLRWAEEVNSFGKSVIVLVPEISLTPQMTKRFRDRFGKNVAILHSKLSEGERFDQWEMIRTGECRIVVGARSAVFAPVKDLGTIIVDEEGEPTFKQNEAPRYHAREVAEERCKLESALLVLGTATPTMETFSKAQDGYYRLVRLPQRILSKPLPKVEVVDMRYELAVKNNRSMFSDTLIKAISKAINAGEQVILFLNRRGYSSFVMCRFCGKTIECSKCMVSLVFHASAKILRCHYCGEARGVPSICPACGSTKIKFFGAGTQKIEAEAKRYFPNARIARLDSDTVASSGALENILERFEKKEIDILVGTQMIAKGLDFAGVTLVGIMAADSLLRLPDFRASERNFNLLAQVAGRSGRGSEPGTVILQTYYPEHHSIKHAVTEDYLSFYNEEAVLRKKTFFPPFGHIGLVVLTAENPQRAEKVGIEIRKRFENHSQIWREILGPSPAPIEKIQNKYRFHILVKFSDLELALPILRSEVFRVHPFGVKVSIDVDPFFSL